MSDLIVAKRASSKCNLVASHVRGQIASGRLRGGDRVSTVAQLRNKFEASTAAVDRALFLLSQEGLIVRQHGRGIFVADTATKVKGLIGYMMVESPELQSAYMMHVIRGIQNFAHSRGYELLLINPDGVGYASRIDGLIVHGDAMLTQHGAAPTNVPIVSVMDPSDYGPSVVADDYQGVVSLVNHLIGLGHRRIGTLMWPHMRSVANGRLEPYLATMRKAGLETDFRWMRDLHFFFNGRARTPSEIAYDNMKEWITGDWFGLGCTALVCQNDACAEGVMRAARDFGLKVPDDLSVTGYDATEDRLPEITSVRVPIEQIAVTAAGILHDAIDGKDNGISRILLRTELVPSRSTAPPGTAE